MMVYQEQFVAESYFEFSRTEVMGKDDRPLHSLISERDRDNNAVQIESSVMVFHQCISSTPLYSIVSIRYTA